MLVGLNRPNPNPNPNPTPNPNPNAEPGPLLVNFNQLYKLSATAGSLWCGTLLRAPSARLWLLRQPSDGEPHVRAELATCGIDHRRLLFAPLVTDIPEHVLRTRAAQLLLDTPEYNCHTTGSDALWASVPVRPIREARLPTRDWEPMAARVGGSLLWASSTLSALVHGLREYADEAAELVRGG